ncbi:30S ribosomal protein S6 [Rhodovarius crocodyli]|uniref:Small ribosomal subunit protein bS6 n=1 Tax=Rhodovarius crocodyli TaxID=1979269 RepID=A0A437MCM0_9PROT|nr:30S ribosomal protein S6 [Rhodovarius crocodyli]RVT95390.1 30S ribosomal protein S6 [Rhodovarius crocodyli]
MPLYECVFIARNDVSQQQVDTTTDTLETLISEHGGAVRKREYWGLRSLAYRVKKNRKGHYTLLGIEADAPTILEVERQLGLHEDVLRTLTIRIEEISEEPSAILAKRGDDRERGFRGPKPTGRFASGRGRGDDREEFRARSRDELDVSEIEE